MLRLAFTPPTPTAEIAALIPPTDSMSLGIGSFLNSFPLELVPPKSILLGYLIRHFHLSN